MSQIYINEPPTSGKVILRTSFGDVEIELWTKEAPKACQNFLQLCMDGYYDRTIFHRIVKGFMAQGGDPTGTGLGGESIYGEEFADEFHQRLKFTHRGRVACASNGPNTNGSQFFITFDRCEWLDKKNTIFGKVVGNTIFNVLRLETFEVDGNERPTNPPYIISTEIIINPFENMVQRQNVRTTEAQPTTDRPKMKKGKKDLKLLSFGEEEQAFEKSIPKDSNLKIRSAHDVLNDPKLLSEPAVKLDQPKSEEAEKGQQKQKIKDVIRRVQQSEEPVTKDEEARDFDKTMKQKVSETAPKRKRNDSDDDNNNNNNNNNHNNNSDDNNPFSVDGSKKKEAQVIENEYKKLKRELKQQRKNLEQPPQKEEVTTKKLSKDDLKASSFGGGASVTDPYARVHSSKRISLKSKKANDDDGGAPAVEDIKLPRGRKHKTKDESDVLQKLEAFSAHIRKERSKQKTTDQPEVIDPSTGIPDAPTTQDDDDNDRGWMAAKFECAWEKRRRAQEAALEEQRAVEDYVSIDPRVVQGGASDTRSRHQRGLDRSRKVDRF